MPTSRPILASTRPSHTAITSTPITLHFRDAPARAVFEEIGRQMSVVFPIQPVDLWDTKRRGLVRTVTIDCDDQPFWTVIRDASAKSGITFRANSRTTVFNLGRGMPIGPGLLAGPCLIVPDSLQVNASVPLNDPAAAQRDLWINYLINVQPDARLIKCSMTARSAVDDRGENLLPSVLEKQPSQFRDNLARWHGTIPLRYQFPRTGATLSHFQGELHLFFQSKSACLELPYPLEKEALTREFTLEGRRLKITGNLITRRSTSEEWEVDIQLLKVPGGDPQWNWLLQTPNICELLDANGRPLNGPMAMPQSTPTSIRYTQRFIREKPDPQSIPGPPVKLVIEVPTVLKEIIAPVEFHDWALP